MHKSIHHRAVETIVKHPCLLGEGPLWDMQRNAIWWIDIAGRQILKFGLQDRDLKSWQIDQMPGCAALMTDGRLLVAVENGFGILHEKTGIVNMICYVEDDQPLNRFNDGKCDPAGRFWAGSMSITEAHATGNVYRMEGDLSLSIPIADVTISNGMAWDADHNLFYYIDTPTREVVAYNYQPITGKIDNRHVVIRVPVADGSPDGMTIDKEGKLWIALWDGWQVGRYDPVTGEKIDQIDLPVARPTSCTFGGIGMDELYISSARIGLSDDELDDQPLAGSLFVAKNMHVKGIETYKFKYDNNNE